jgi:aspartate carbamoyltransferase catalytic subunit
LSSTVSAGSVLSVSGLELETIGAILALAAKLEREDPIKRAARLAKRRVALLFYESSTRTRTSLVCLQASRRAKR